MRLRLLPILTTAVVAAAAGYFAHDYFFAERGAGPAQSQAVDLGGKPLMGQRRPDYTLGRVDGAIVSASDFDGQVVLVNFWATWCAPCREEMPMLMELRHRFRDQGLEVVGIALDDVARARDFAAEIGIDYPVLVGSTDVMAMVRLYGNDSGTLPYSVLIDRDGIVRWTLLGVLEQKSLVDEIQTLLGGT
jgi:peroxiredoxin